MRITAPAHRPGLAGLAALLLALVCLPAAHAEDGEGGKGAEAAPRPQAKTALGLEGSAFYEKPGKLGSFEFRYDAEVDSRGEDANELTSGNLLLVHPGGWMIPLDPDPADGSFFRGALEVPANKVTKIAGQKYLSPAPATHTVLALYARDGHAQVVSRIERLGYTRPGEYAPPWPFGIGIVGPLEVVKYSDGRSSAMVVGQHQVLGGSTPTKLKTSIGLSSDRGAAEPVAWEGLDSRGDRTVLWPFVRRLDVDAKFTKGLARIEATATLDGKAERFVQTWPVARVKPAAVRAPVLGTWQLGNGPGQTDMHPHSANPLYRYAYDFVVVEQGRTHRGEPHKNESYFAWNRSIRAVADGEVTDFCYTQRDNPGYRGTASNCPNNYIVIRHADGLHTAYMHLKQRSVPKGLQEGSKVKAGDVIGRVGNSGVSSEPHLHFMAFRIDATGRWVAVPVTFTNAHHDARGKRPVEGVPVGGSVLHFRKPR